MTIDLDLRRKKLLYRASYRGFKEADLLIGGFAKAHLPEMDTAELDAFEVLLKLDDRDLYDWATGKRPAPQTIEGPVFERIKAFNIAAMIHGSASA